MNRRTEAADWTAIVLIVGAFIWAAVAIWAAMHQPGFAWHHWLFG